MYNAKGQLLDVLKQGVNTLADMKDSEKFKQIQFLKPTGPVFLPLKTFIREFFVVDVLNKQEPLTIKIQSGENINVYLSLVDKYPNEANAQTIYKG